MVLFFTTVPISAVTSFPVEITLSASVRASVFPPNEGNLIFDKPLNPVAPATIGIASAAVSAIFENDVAFSLSCEA